MDFLFYPKIQYFEIDERPKEPTNENTYIRVMPGKPLSSNPCQQKPYVRLVKNGQYLDKYGKIVDRHAPEAHIPIDEFVYISKQP